MDDLAEVLRQERLGGTRGEQCSDDLLGLARAAPALDGQPAVTLSQSGCGALEFVAPPHVARAFPLNQAADAQRALDEHYLGKLALRPN